MEDATEEAPPDPAPAAAAPAAPSGEEEEEPAAPDRPPEEPAPKGRFLQKLPSRRPSDASLGAASVGAMSAGAMSLGGGSVGSMDLSALFDTSALTRLLKGMHDTIHVQQAKITELEAAAAENAAFRELWQEEQAEFRHALVSAKQTLQKEADNIVNAAGAGVAELRMELDRAAGFRRICAFIQHVERYRDQHLMQKQVDKWKHASSQMTLWIKRRAVLVKISNLAENGHILRALNKWRDWNDELKQEEMLKRGGQAVADAIHTKFLARRAFRKWSDLSLKAQLEDAFGGQKLPEPSAEKEKALKVAAAAAKPFFARAGKAEEAGNHDASFAQAQQGVMQIMKVITAEADLARAKDREDIEKMSLELRQALATVAGASEERRKEEQKLLGDRFQERLDRQLAQTRNQIDGRIAQRIQDALDHVDQNAKANLDQVEAKSRAMTERLETYIAAADDAALEARSRVDVRVAKCEMKVQDLRTQLGGVSGDVMKVEGDLRTVYEDLRKHVVWERLQRQDADNAGQSFLRASLGHNAVDLSEHMQKESEDRATAFQRAAQAAEQSLGRLLGDASQHLSNASRLAGEVERESQKAREHALMAAQHSEYATSAQRDAAAHADHAARSRADALKRAESARAHAKSGASYAQQAAEAGLLSTDAAARAEAEAKLGVLAADQARAEALSAADHAGAVDEAARQLSLQPQVVHTVVEKHFFPQDHLPEDPTEAAAKATAQRLLADDGTASVDSPPVLADGFGAFEGAFEDVAPLKPAVVVAKKPPLQRTATAPQGGGHRHTPFGGGRQRRVGVTSLDSGRVKGSLWHTIEMNHAILTARLDDLRDTTDVLQEKTATTLGGAPPKPDARALANEVVGPYEELVFERRRLLAPPRDLANEAALAARALSAHAAAVANLEEIARVARGAAAQATATLEFDPRTGRSLGGPSEPAGGPDDVARRRLDVVRDFCAELQDHCVRQRPTAGALRLEARLRFVKRFQEAAEAALSIYDQVRHRRLFISSTRAEDAAQVIADAPTLMGRSRALPACVACNRPLPTKGRRAPPSTPGESSKEPPRPLTEVQTLLASRGPDMPRPLSAPGGGKRMSGDMHSRSAAQIRRLEANVPRAEYVPRGGDFDARREYGATPLSESSAANHDHGAGDAQAFLRQRAEYDAAAAKREMQRQRAAVARHEQGVLDPSHQPPPQTRGFRATKRLPKRPQSAPRAGRMAV